MIQKLHFPIGEKVICLHADFPAEAAQHFPQLPVENGIYTISHIQWSPEHVTGRIALGICLTELPRLPESAACLSWWRFRLLSDEKILRARQRGEPSSFQHPTSNPEL